MAATETQSWMGESIRSILNGLVLYQAHNKNEKTGNESIKKRSEDAKQKNSIFRAIKKIWTSFSEKYTVFFTEER